MGSCNKNKMSEIEHQLSDSEDSSDIGSGTDSSDSSSGSESESSSEGENVPMTRMNSRKIKLRKEMADSKASEVFTKMLEKNNKNINNTNKQTLGSTLGSSAAGNLPFSTKNILIRSAKTGMENLQLVFKNHLQSWEVESKLFLMSVDDLFKKLNLEVFLLFCYEFCSYLAFLAQYSSQLIWFLTKSKTI